MNDDTLKKLWQGQKLGSSPTLPDPQQLKTMKQKMKDFDKVIASRDYKELWTAIPMALFFLVCFFFVDSAIAKTGCTVIVASCLYISRNLVVSKRGVPKADANMPVMESIGLELRGVEVQIRLLSSVFWWYILPLMIGSNLFFCGVDHQPLDRTIYFVVTLFVNVVIYRANRKAVRQQLRPLKQELECLLGSSAQP